MISKYSDLILAALVIAVLGMIIIPLPTWLLDGLISGNLAIAVIILLAALYISDALKIASFPTILLMTTLYRLALNIAATRLILSQGHAGEVIAAFGSFVVAGNYIVGGILFIIITLINFIVIAKGAERVSEVGARFTLDAMPGKQMSIDADLRAGIINMEQAMERRSTLQRESQLYGAMDGAMKFVKGDAIAAIVITIINIIAGFIIGVVQRDLNFADAIKTYSLLTIGDGLVAQIPALIISVAAGVVVTRVASETKESNLGRDIVQQITQHPKAIGIASLLFAIMALVPGLPKAPFFVMSGFLGGLVLLLLRGRQQAARQIMETPKEEVVKKAVAKQG
ncbi:MAG: FHIPEP family type III secretion protein, partial [Deltaproteobacteria bacterium]|nr:FHIPEP family type III secretion protein [Deltaproteobacteria bacterium]